jgi:membrane fusion protein, heavy metal efflux system
MRPTFFLLCLSLAGLSGLAGCSRSDAVSSEATGTAAGFQAKRSDAVRPGALAEPAGRGAGRNPGRGAGRGFGRAVALTDAERGAIGFETTRASLRPLRSEMRAMGSVLAPRTRQAIVSYPFTARIAAVHVSLGDWVKAGTKVVTLQSEEVGTAKAAYHKAVTDADLARSCYEREKRLFERGVGAQKAYQASEAEWKLARAELATTEKRLHVLGLTDAELERVRSTHDIDPVATLYAPIAGKVVEIGPVLGAMVDQATEILTIMDPTILWVDAEVFERDIARLRMGQEVAVTVPAYPGETFPGRVTYIGDRVKSETRTIVVRSEVNNPGHRIRPGMFANVGFTLRDDSGVLALPERAILDDPDGKLVFVRSDSGFIAQGHLPGPQRPARQHHHREPGHGCGGRGAADHASRSRAC